MGKLVSQWPKNIDPEKVAALIRAIADQYILPRYNMLGSNEIMSKSRPDDLVTVADQEAEAAFERELPKLYPGTIVIGEEGVSAKRVGIAVLKESDKVIWVIDPVDGTWNFVHGGKNFAVMVACVMNGEVAMGWIYDVPGRRMMIAQKGAGVAMDGQPLQVAAPQKLADCNGFAGSLYFPKQMRPLVTEFKGKVQSLETLRCAGHEYIRLTSGAVDFGIYSKIRPWDHLAGTLAVTEAGGCVLKWDGTPYKPGDDFGGLVAASNPALMKDIQKALINNLVKEYKQPPKP